jgi:hypothetical protein
MGDLCCVEGRVEMKARWTSLLEEERKGWVQQRKVEHVRNGREKVKIKERLHVFGLRM